MSEPRTLIQAGAELREAWLALVVAVAEESGIARFVAWLSSLLRRIGA